MSLYQLLLVLKLSSVIGFAGGAVAALLATDAAARKRAVHGVASPSLLATWLAGYALATLEGIPLSRPWIVGSLILSSFVNVALVYCAARGRRGALPTVAVAVPLFGIIVLMVLKPGGAVAP